MTRLRWLWVRPSPGGWIQVAMIALWTALTLINWTWVFLPALVIGIGSFLWFQHAQYRYLERRRRIQAHIEERLEEIQVIMGRLVDEDDPPPTFEQPRTAEEEWRERWDPLYYGEQQL